MPEPTPLQIVTLAIAVAGLLVALLSLGLGIRRDRREVRGDVAINADTEGSDLVVSFTNVSHRPLSIARAGFNSIRDGRHDVFKLWSGHNGRVVGGRVVTDAALPSPALQPGDPAYVARTPMHLVKSATYPASPISVWCEDERGNFYMQYMSVAVKQALWATKRRAPGPEDEYGHPTEIEIADDEG